MRRFSCFVPALLAGLLATAGGPAVAADAPPAAPPAASLSFRDFFRLPVGPRGLELSPVLLAAHGRMVRLVGHVVVQERPAAGHFLLTPRPVRMSEHADGEADDLPPQTVTVWLDARQRDRVVEAPEGPVELVGRLEVGRHEGADGRVSWVRLHLGPDAIRRTEAVRGAP